MHFLLSPASCHGRRAELLFREGASSAVARGLRDGGVPLGEVFTFVSALYFRGKLTYARAFASGWVRVITPGGGLVDPEQPVTIEDLRRFAAASVDLKDLAYRRALEAEAARIPDGEVVLLGSVATRKYLDPLLAVLGERLYYPAEFVGLGDMARGSRLLKAAAAGRPLAMCRAG